MELLKKVFPDLSSINPAIISQCEHHVPTNKFTQSMLSLDQLEQLHQMNVSLSKQVQCQCSDLESLENQIVVGTTFCQTLGFLLTVYQLKPEEIVLLTQKYDVIWPWTIQYDNLRTNTNKRFVRFPIAIVFPRDATEVSFWVKFCSDHGFTVSIRAGGNNYESFSISNQIIIDLTYLKFKI